MNLDHQTAGLTDGTRGKTEYSKQFQVNQNRVQQKNNTLERNRLANDISRYELKDTFNTNKLGFFLRVLPNKTLQLKGEKFGSAANATGEKNLYRAFTSHK